MRGPSRAEVDGGADQAVWGGRSGSKAATRRRMVDAAGDAKAPGRWCHHDQRWHEGGKIMEDHGRSCGEYRGMVMEMSWGWYRESMRKHTEMFPVSKIVQVFGWVNRDEMLPGRTDRHIWRWQTCHSARNHLWGEPVSIRLSCRPGWNTFRRSPRIKLRSLTFGRGPNRVSQMAFHWDLHRNHRLS